MKNLPKWYYDEPSHAGVNYSAEEVAAEYDEHHTKFRNYEDEANRIIQALNLGKEDIVLDMGCGSGELAIHLAKHCKEIYAIDISPRMVSLCKGKIEKNSIDNIQPICAGFLSYIHEGDPVDAVVSNVVLHHLPDFWKQIALKKIYHLLKPGGRFFLFDVVFSFPVDNHVDSIDGWLSGMRENAGEAMMEESVIHVKEEYSTWDWILEGMIERAGFQIMQTVSEMPNTKAYICVRNIHTV